MDNVISFQDFAASGSGSDDCLCWICQQPTSPRALFCHHCGAIQPVRDIDHFTRLGVEKRIDLDLEILDKQYAGFLRSLDPSRFLLRGINERAHAVRQLEALNAAYETLRDPLKRGRYWIALHREDYQNPDGESPEVMELKQNLLSASEASSCDWVAQRAGKLVEEGVRQMLKALRSGDWKNAVQVLSEIDGLEAILKTVRARRNELTVPGEPGIRLSDDL